VKSPNRVLPGTSGAAVPLCDFFSKIEWGCRTKPSSGPVILALVRAVEPRPNEDNETRRKGPPTTTEGSVPAREVCDMPMRFKLLVTAFFVVVLVKNRGDVQGNMTDVFIGLGLLLAICVVSLWPNDGRKDRVDRQLEGENWASRVDVEALARERGASSRDD